MYSIEIPKDFTKADGNFFLKIKEDKDGRRVPRLDEHGNPVVVMTTEGQRQQYETEQASFLDMLKGFLNNVFDLVAMKAKEDKSIQRLKLEDSANALDVFRAINVANSTIDLEKATYEWLKKMLDAYAVDFFGINAAVIIEPIRKAQEIDPSRAERRREEKAAA